MTRILVGTYGTGERQGIWEISFDFASGWCGRPVRMDSANQSSYLCRRGEFIYAISEVRENGMLHAFRYEDGKLAPLNRVEGLEPVLAHLCISLDGRHVFRISYGTGCIGSYATGADGSLTAGEGRLLHSGCGPFPGRQTQAHGHSITPAPDGRHVIACDLGTDDVLCLSFGGEDGSLRIEDSMGIKLPPGSGPRQQAWHPSGECLYVVSEMGYQIATLAWDPVRGLSLLDCREIRPEMPKCDREGAAVKVSGDGRYLYTSCRLDNMLDIFRIGEDRIPVRVATVPSGVEQPRDFLITRDGEHLLAAGQRSGDIQVFRRDPESGLLAAECRIEGLEKPVCLLEL